MADENKNLTQQAVTWITGQSFNNVLLVLILCAIGWGGWYSLTTVIPSHLKQIQQGYETIDNRHREERESTIRTYDKWFDRRVAHDGTN